MQRLANKKEIYFNPAQLKVLKSTAKTTAFIGGRGTGKSTVIGARNYLRMKYMPGAKAFLSSTTYNQILSKTLPAMEAKWNEMGLVEGVHYVVGQRPPSHFKMPLAPPRKNWQYFITFFTGYCMELLSMDRPDKARGGSYQAGDIDEAALIKHEHFTRVIMFSTRGFRHIFDSSPYYRQIGIYTSMPWKPEGMWVLDYEEKSIANPDRFCYIESTAYDNVHVLGAETLKQWEEETPYLEFQVEVLNKRVRKANNAFYSQFNTDKHLYKPSYLYGEGRKGLETRKVEDWNHGALLECSFDFSGWFSCCSIWQEKDNVERCIRSLFVKQDDKINELVDKVCKQFAEHQFKYIRLWGEPRGHDKQPTGDDIYTIIKKRFEFNGWRAEIRAHAGRTTNHKERNTLINDIFTEAYHHLPRIRLNEEFCKDMIIALQITEIKPDFSKDKKNEKDRTFPQEHAPHFTDTLDYYLVQKHGWKVEQSRRPAWYGFS